MLIAILQQYNFHFRVENLCTVYRHLSQKTQVTFISKKIYVVQRGVMLMEVIINMFAEFYAFNRGFYCSKLIDMLFNPLNPNIKI